jgi:hypothetical protein
MSKPVPKSRMGILPQEERMAIIEGARKLGLDPYEFGGFLSLESGVNMDPNIVGGAGGRHKGLIQFGSNEQKLYGIAGPQTRASQMPKVLQYFQDRGFKPGMGIDRAYATVLGGNPNVSLSAKDSFGTSVAGALPRFKKGGDLYKNAERVLGDLPGQVAIAQGNQKPNRNLSVSEILAPILGGAANASVEEKKSIANTLLDEVKSSITENILKNVFNPFGGFQ